VVNTIGHAVDRRHEATPVAASSIRHSAGADPALKEKTRRQALVVTTKD
jgi:hypothetical protein